MFFPLPLLLSISVKFNYKQRVIKSKRLDYRIIRTVTYVAIKRRSPGPLSVALPDVDQISLPLQPIAGCFASKSSQTHNVLLLSATYYSFLLLIGPLRPNARTNCVYIVLPRIVRKQ